MRTIFPHRTTSRSFHDSQVGELPFKPRFDYHRWEDRRSEMERIIVQRKSAGDINAVVQKRSELQELTKRADALRADRKQHAKMLGSCTDPADRERAIQRGTVRSAAHRTETRRTLAYCAGTQGAARVNRGRAGDRLGLPDEKSGAASSAAPVPAWRPTRPLAQVKLEASLESIAAHIPNWVHPAAPSGPLDTMNGTNGTVRCSAAGTCVPLLLGVLRRAFYTAP